MNRFHLGLVMHLVKLVVVAVNEGTEISQISSKISSFVFWWTKSYWFE